MTENDKKLIEQAMETPFTDWFLIDKLIEKADDWETKNRLHSIQKSLYHKEEYYAGLL
jgi:hypothetical protein